jgi:hypothetical protein
MAWTLHAILNHDQAPMGIPRQSAVAPLGIRWQTPTEFASTFNPRRALALRNAKSSVPSPAVPPAQQGKSNPGNELKTG